jgi:glycosyltransferase involved in cell wall biosynthesis
MIVHGQKVDVWDKKLTLPVIRHFSISLCTTCMNRLHDLRQTLLKNIDDNADYKNLEFILVDYNSQDGLSDWVKENLMSHIESGRVIYARTDEPTHFHMGHSRNIAFKLANGEIVCNVDADNWTSSGFAAALNRVANQRPERAVFTKSRQRVRGRVGFYKKEWEDLLGGYDESLTDYGFDDMDLIHRALLQGFRWMCFGGEYVSRIKTDGGDKVANMVVKDWRKTETLNCAKSAANIEQGKLRANAHNHWGAAILQKNFSEEIVL